MSMTPALDTPAADGDDLDALLGDEATEPYEPDEVDDVDEPDEVDDETGDDGEGPARPAGRSKASVNRALIRRVATKAGELAGAPKERRETLAKLLGAGPDLADLTYAVMTADRSAMAPVADLNAIAEADPFSAGVVAASQGRNRMKAVWSLLQNLGADIPASVPASDAKAAMALAPAVHRLPQKVRDELHAGRRPGTQVLTSGAPPAPHTVTPRHATPRGAPRWPASSPHVRQPCGTRLRKCPARGSRPPTSSSGG